MERLPSDQWDEGPGLLESAWRYRWLVVAAILVGGLIGYGWSARQPVLYEGASSILLADPRGTDVLEDNTRPAGDPARRVRNQAQVVTSTPVMERAAKLSGVSSSAVRQGLSVEPGEDLDVITIRVLDPDPEGAARRADAVALAYEQVATEEALRRARRAIAELEATSAKLRAVLARSQAALNADPDAPGPRVDRDAAAEQLAAVTLRARELAIDARLSRGGVDQREQAVVPDQPVQPRPRRTAAAGALLGLIGAAGLAWWLNMRRGTVGSGETPRRVLGIPLLGEIPDRHRHSTKDSIPTVTDSRSSTAEAYQFVVAALEGILSQTGARTLLITCPQPATGKTMTAINLAIRAAEDGRRVVVVDGDLRQQGLSRLFGITGRPGLTDLADDAVLIDKCIWLTESGQIVPAGSRPLGSAGFVRAPAFRKALSRIAERADLTLVDSPALLDSADAVNIAGQVEGIVLVVHRKTPVKFLKEAGRRLALAGPPVLGYIFHHGPPNPQIKGRQPAHAAPRRRGTTQHGTDPAQPDRAPTAGGPV